MRRMPRLEYFWPGLPQLWHRGLWSGLILATGFAVLLELLLLGSFVWVEWLSPRALRLGWMAAGSLWGASAILSFGFHRPAAGTSSADLVYRESLKHYLQGSWFEAEASARRLLRLTPRDVEGRLLLATVLRRTGRYDEALGQLDRLGRLRASVRWEREIAEERQRIAEHIASSPDTEPIFLEGTPEEIVVRRAA